MRLPISEVIVHIQHSSHQSNTIFSIQIPKSSSCSTNHHRNIHLGHKILPISTHRYSSNKGITSL
ncbi:unnamed protein product, partial [Musa acuminata subsp. burmannicoides]